MMRKIVAAAVLLMLASCASAQAKYDSASIEPPYIEPGDTVTINVKFHEGLTKREIYVTPVSNGERLPIGEKADTAYYAVLVPKDEATRRYVLIKEGERPIGHLFAGETWTAPFEIQVLDGAPTTNYTLTFRLTRGSLEGFGREVALTRDITIVVNGAPKFTADSDSELTAGQTKSFMVAIGNVGGGTARQVTVTLNATSPLTVLKASGQYLGDMNGIASAKLYYDLYVDSTASPKAYTLPVEIKYTDREGNQQTVGKTLGVKVSGKPNVMASIDSFDDMKAGMTGKVTVSVANKGFVEAKFLSLSLLDSDKYTVASKSDVYIGNLASDDFQSEDFRVNVADGIKGKVPLKVRVSYTEENDNEVHTEEFELPVTVMSPEDYDKAHPTTDSRGQLIMVAVLIPAVIVGYVALWLLYKVAGAVTGLIDRKVFRRQ